MSNIIKSGRIRSQSFLDLSQRPMNEQSKEYESDMESCSESKATNIDTELLHKRKEELARIEMEVEQKKAEASQQVEAILAEAIGKKCEILKSAKTEETAILAQAHQKQAELVQLAEDEAQQIIESAHHEKRTLLESIEGEVVETLITLLQHIISAELETNVQWIKLVVRKMMLEDRTAETFKLHVSPKNLQNIEQEKEKFMEGLTKICEIKADEMLNDTSCKLITSQGNIEYDVSQGLERMIQEIRILQGIS